MKERVIMETKKTLGTNVIAGARSRLAAPCLILSLVAGIVPHILMQGKINEIITFENSVEVAPCEEPVEVCEEN